jgi:hypothetical protein
LTDHIGRQDRIKLVFAKGKSLNRTLLDWH